MNAQAMSGEPATRGHVLLLGDERDPVCALARESLARCGQSSRLVTSLADLRLSIRLGDGAPAVGMRFDDGLSIIDADVRGVLLRTASGLCAEGWDPADLEYASAEARSTLIAWLWSLACPVVNRPRPELWYCGQASAFGWRRELRRAGLPLKPHSVRCGTGIDVRRGLPAHALLTTGTGAAAYDVRDGREWESVQRLAAMLPVTLAPRHGSAAVACVVSGAVVWARDPALLFRACEPALARLAAVAGLDLFEVGLVDVDGRACVEAIDAWGSLRAFDEAARRDIGARLARALMRPAADDLLRYESAYAASWIREEVTT